MTIESFDPSKLPFWASLKTSQAYNTRLTKLSADNVAAAIRFAARLSMAKSPADFSDAVTTRLQDQFNLLCEQFNLLTEEAEELSELVEEAAPKKDDEAPIALGD